MHGDSEAKGSFEDTSISVLRAVDLQVEVDPVVHLGSTSQHEYTGDDTSMPEHTAVRDSSQRHTAGQRWTVIGRRVRLCA
jgi:hypothetical protein